ncbi:MAG: DUF2079 domain-containing protein [Chloroflexota bacterium]
MADTLDRRRIRPPAVPVQTASRPSRMRRATILCALAIVCVAYALFFGWLSLQRYWAYEMHAQDMGNMGQATWNTIHGHPFFFTNVRLPFHIEAWNTTTRLSFHVEPLFPVVSLVYLLYPHPESLLILQTIALSLGALPVYLLARDVLRHAGWGVLFVLLYFLYPTLEALNLYEFHAVSLATPLLLFAFLFLERRQTVPFVVCALLAMGTKEEIGLVVAMFGLYAALIERQRGLGIAMVVIGAGWSLFATLVIEHHFRQPGTYTYIQSRYSYLGHGIHGLLHTVVHNPGVFLRVLFVWPKLGYLERLLAPVGYIALFAPAALLLGLPTLLINMFSQTPSMVSGLGDNSAELIAVVMIAGILGTRTVLNLLRQWTGGRVAAILVAVYLVAQALWSHHLNGFTPAGASFQRPSIGAHQQLINRFVAMVPPGVPVATQDQIDPHLSSRHYLYLFGDTGRTGSGVQPANYVLLDVSAPTYAYPSYQLHDDAEKLLQHGWGVAAADDGLILIHQGISGGTPPRAFYSYMDADHTHIPNQLQNTSLQVDIRGYGVAHTDLPNHTIPNLAYTFYLRPLRRLSSDVEPVVYETQGGRLLNCVAHPLGLAWYPSTRWSPRHTYAVRLDTLETVSNDPGSVRLWMEMIPTPTSTQERVWGQTFCQTLWTRRGHLVNVGSMDLGF